MASFALGAPALAVAFMAGRLASWAVGKRANYREGRRRLRADPQIGGRWPRQRVARALLLSLMPIARTWLPSGGPAQLDLTAISQRRAKPKNAPVLLADRADGDVGEVGEEALAAVCLEVLE